MRAQRLDQKMARFLLALSRGHLGRAVLLLCWMDRAVPGKRGVAAAVQVTAHRTCCMKLHHDPLLSFCCAMCSTHYFSF